MLHNLYVDDCLKATGSEEELIRVATEVKDMLAKGGFKLTKFAFNNRELLTMLPIVDRGKKVKETDLCHDALPTERTLSIK